MTYSDPESETDNIYHNLINVHQHRCDIDGWKYKLVPEWNSDESVSWVYDCVIKHGYNLIDVPLHNFRLPGVELREKRREEIIKMMEHPHVDPIISGNIAALIFDMMQRHLSKKLPVMSYDASSDDSECTSRMDATSLACWDSGDESKSENEYEEVKPIKRPPGRPKGSTKKEKRPPVLTILQFLKNLLLDERFCPLSIRWENHSQGLFRIVQPEIVAKLWGQIKGNDGMNFEKFSRAMRYHYKNGELISNRARLVYQFGPNGPDIGTGNPNFGKVKSDA